MFRLPNPSAPQSPAPSRTRFQNRAPPVRLGRRSSVAVDKGDDDDDDDDATSLVEMRDDEQEFEFAYRNDDAAAAVGPGGVGSQREIHARQSRRRSSHLEHRHVTVSTLVRGGATAAADGLARRRYVEFAVAEPRNERKHAVHSSPLTSSPPPPFATLVDRPVVYRLARVRHHSYNRTVSFRLVRVSSSSHRTAVVAAAAAGARLVSSDFLRATDKSENRLAPTYGTGPTRLAVAAGSLAELDGRVTVNEREAEEEDDEEDEWIASSSAPPVTDLAFAHVRPASASVRVHDGGDSGGGGHGRVALGAVLSDVEWEHEPADPRDTFYLDLLPSPPPSAVATTVTAHQPRRRRRHQQQQQHLASTPQFHSTHGRYATAPAVETFGETEYAVAAFPALPPPLPSPPPPPSAPGSVPYPAPSYPPTAFSAFSSRPLVAAPSFVLAANDGSCRKTVGTDHDRRRRRTTPVAPAAKSYVGASDNGADETVTADSRERKRESSRERDLLRRWRKAGRPDPDALAFTTTRRQMEYAAVAFLVGFVACIALGLLRRRSPPSSRARRRKSRDRSESPPANRN